LWIISNFSKLATGWQSIPDEPISQATSGLVSRAPAAGGGYVATAVQ
jgi:hypothetical protein